MGRRRRVAAYPVYDGRAGHGSAAFTGHQLLHFILTSHTALISHLKNRLIDLKLALWAVAAGAVTTALAALLATGLDTQIVRKIFGGFVVVIGLMELFRKCPKSAQS